jgi:hypothetical protein
MLQAQPDVSAVLVSSTSTQTVTSYITMTGSGATTLYQTFTQVTNVPTTTGTTYTTSGLVMVPVPVTAVGRYTAYSTQVEVTRWSRMSLITRPVSTITYYTTTTNTGTITWILYASARTVYSTYQVLFPMSSTRTIINSYVMPTTGVVIVPSPTQVQGAVTSLYTTNMPTTVFSTAATTSTYQTGQVIGITNTQTFTSVTDVQPPAPSIGDILSQNWYVLLGLAAVMIVLAFSLGRRSRSGPRMTPAPQAVQVPKPGVVYCMSCGAQNPATSEFCGKCGTKL